MDNDEYNIDIRSLPELMKLLLKDRTTSKNIIWASNSYSGMGKDFLAKSCISLKWALSEYKVIKSRNKKNKCLQKERTRGKAEVFTPTWIVKRQNDLIEEEIKNFTLDDYINFKWLELACGEAPYMCNRYDNTSGAYIDIDCRVGFVDRKLQRISKKIENHDEWLNFAIQAYKASYGYEFQGDSLLIARENLLHTFIDYYINKFNREPDIETIKEIAKIISYNVFQMDGIKYTIPYSEDIRISHKDNQISLFDNGDSMDVEIIKEGIKAKIKIWKIKKNVEFESLTKKEEQYMKFDVVIGNPPYQENDNGIRESGVGNASASPLYHLFVDSAISVGSMQSLIIPARWITGAGKGLGKFSEKMIRSTNIRYFTYFLSSKDVFPNNDIPGGVCYFIRENNYSGKANIETNYLSKIEVSKRYFDEHGFGVFIPFNKLTNILVKVKKMADIDSENIQTIVSVRKPYGLSTDYFRNTKKYNLPNVQDSLLKSDDIEVFGLNEGKRASKFIPRNYPIPFGNDTIFKYKVFLPYAYGGGMLGEVESVTMLGKPLIGKPGQICTETYLSIGNFEEECQAENLLKYIKTKFFRVLVGVLKSTQHATRTFRLVPLQDFTSTSDIDWSQSIADVDKQLYNKYGLTQEEINFIETNVKEMK